MISQNTMLKNNFTWGGTQPFFQLPFVSSFILDLKGKKVLDCGCGKGINGYMMRVTRDTSGARMIGLDYNADYLSFCRAHKVYDEYIRSNLPKTPLKNKSVDFLLCIEVSEHLAKSDGRKLVSVIDRVCRGWTLITTPNVSFQTIKAEHEDARYSLRSADDLRGRGYKVYEVGLKVVLNPGDFLLRLKQALHYSFTPVSYLIPELGSTLICVKDF